MKAESPVARVQQAEMEIGSWLRTHLPAAGGALEVVLHRRVKRSELLLNKFDQLLIVLAGYCQNLVDSDYLLKELIRSPRTCMEHKISAIGWRACGQWSSRLGLRNFGSY